MLDKKIALIMVYNTEKIKQTFEQTKVFLKNHSVFFLSFESVEEFANSDVKFGAAIVVGGDGSILAVAEIAAKKQVPLVGIHRGKLGFLSDIDPERLDVLIGELIVEHRSMLEVQVNSSSERYLALNEFAMNRTDNTHLLYFQIYVDGNLMYAQRSDGALVHTPTGSTAYALSAGGSIIQPMVNAIGIVPLNPHRINTRPIIIKNTQTINLVLSDQQNVILSCDGRTISQESISSILIKRSEHVLTLLHPSDYDYFKVLRTKLGWEH